MTEYQAYKNVEPIEEAEPQGYAQLCERLRREVLASISVPLDAQMQSELSALLSQLIDEIAAQCALHPHSADSIIASAVQGVVSELSHKVESKKEQAAAMQEASQDRATKAKKEGKALVRSTYRVAQVSTVTALHYPQYFVQPIVITPDDYVFIDDQVPLLFDEAGGLPDSMTFMSNANGEWIVELRLQDGVRSVWLPSSDIQQVRVEAQQGEDMLVTVLSAPRPDAATGKEQYHRRELRWSQEAIEAVVGAEVDAQSLTEKLGADAALMERLFAAHLEAQRRALEEYEREMQASKTCFAFEHFDALPDDLRANVPNAAFLAGAKAHMLLPALAH